MTMKYPALTARSGTNPRPERRCPVAGPGGRRVSIDIRSNLPVNISSKDEMFSGYDSRMDGDADIAAIAAVLADRRRCRVLMALGDGRALTASVLASEAGVAPSTASEHLAKLVRAGLISVEQRGRHRYFRLAGPNVADLLEAMAVVAPPAPIRSLSDETKARAIRAARTCYDHLAGRLGVATMDSLLERGWLEGEVDGSPRSTTRSSQRRIGGLAVTESGAVFLEELGIDLDHLPPRRPALRFCIDWSEQRPHLAGAVGAALTARLFDLGWIRRADRSRAVRVTDEGRSGFADTFGVRVDEHLG
jgi:DNA-binding transcriptional ArsR family regulator